MSVDRSYKIAVIGPIPRDSIITHEGKEFKKYGCVTHTAIALSHLVPKNSTIYPVTHLRQRDHGNVLEIFKEYQNIDATHVKADADRGDVVYLKFIDQNRRQEKQVGSMNPIEPADVQPLLNCDAFVFVPITDFEAPLLTLKYIKDNSDAITIFDAHGPTNALTMHGDRLMKPWIERDQWLPYIDFLKMNLEEARCSWFAKEYTLEDLEDLPPISDNECAQFAEHCLEKGVSAVFITVDEKGVMCYYKKNGSFCQENIPAIKVDKVVQTTGCGDSFAAGLAYGVLTDPLDMGRAAQYGNIMGAQRTQGITFDVFLSRDESEKMRRDHYGT